MSKQNKRNQALIKAVEVAARIDPSLFRAEYPEMFCVAYKPSTGTCTRNAGHSGPHVALNPAWQLNGKPWFTTTKRSKSKRIK